MNTRVRYLRFIVILLLAILLFSSVLVHGGNRSGGSSPFTAEEQAWLASHGPTVFVSQSSYPPFEFRQQDGSLDGISVELAHWMATEMGLQTRFVSMNFQEAQQAVLAGSALAVTPIETNGLMRCLHRLSRSG